MAEETFEDWYARYHDRLVAACRRILHDTASAEDVAQETLLRAWVARDKLGARDQVYPWMATVSRNLCTDVLRGRQRTIVSEEIPEAGDDSADPTMSIEVDVDRRAVREALGQVSDHHRRLLVLKDVEGIGYEELATRFGMTKGAARAVLMRARRSLRDALERAGGVVGVLLPGWGWGAYSERLVAGMRSLFAAPGAGAASRPSVATEIAACVVAATLAVGPVAGKLTNRTESPVVQERASALDLGLPANPPTVLIDEAAKGLGKMVDQAGAAVSGAASGPPDLSVGADETPEYVPESTAGGPEGWGARVAVGSRSGDPDSGLVLELGVEPDTEAGVSRLVNRVLRNLPPLNLDLLRRPPAPDSGVPGDAE